MSIRDLIARVRRQAPAASRERRSPAARPAGAAAPEPASTAPAPAPQADLAHQVVEKCAGAGVPEIAANLIRDGATAAVIEAAIDNALDIKRHIAIARRLLPAGVLPDDADLRLIAAGASAAHVGREMLGLLNAYQSPEIINAHQPDKASAAGGAAQGPGAGGAIGHGWDAVIARVQQRQGVAR